MNGDREAVVAAGLGALARLQAAHAVAVETVVDEVRQRTGEELLVRRPGILDAGWADVARMSWQCSNFEAAVRLLRPLLEHDGRTLGAVLKTADPLLVRDVQRHLVEAGVLPREVSS